MLGGIGTIVKHKIRTIASMGRTAFKVSLNFSFNFERWKAKRLYSRVVSSTALYIQLSQLYACVGA